MSNGPGPIFTLLAPKSLRKSASIFSSSSLISACARASNSLSSAPRGVKISHRSANPDIANDAREFGTYFVTASLRSIAQPLGWLVSRVGGPSPILTLAQTTAASSPRRSTPSVNIATTSARSASLAAPISSGLRPRKNALIEPLGHEPQSRAVEVIDRIF